MFVFTYDGKRICVRILSVHVCFGKPVQRGARQLIPRGYTRLLSGDRLIVLATEAGEEALVRCLTEGRLEVEELDP